MEQPVPRFTKLPPGLLSICSLSSTSWMLRRWGFNFGCKIRYFMQFFELQSVSSFLMSYCLCSHLSPVLHFVGLQLEVKDFSCVFCTYCKLLFLGSIERHISHHYEFMIMLFVLPETKLMQAVHRKHWPGPQFSFHLPMSNFIVGCSKAQR